MSTPSPIVVAEAIGAATKRIAPLFDGVRYGNPFPGYSRSGFSDIMKWMWNRKKAEFMSQEVLDVLLPVEKMNWEQIRNPAPDNIQCTWIGHASMLVQMEGFNILTDPIWSERASMVQFMGPKRIRPTPCKLSDLPKIDAVVISHNHYDHLDHYTVKTLGDTPRWFVPKGLKAWFTSCGVENVQELNWWEESSFSDQLRFVCTPCQHWSKRTAFDDFQALWSSWAIVGSSKKFFFTGDTGYCDAFSTIGQEFGPFDLAAIPIGAYEPRWFMKPQHVNPEEAVQIHIDLKSKKSVGMHWGTFILTDEHVMEPPVKLQEAKVQKNLRKNEFIVLNIGGLTIV